MRSIRTSLHGFSLALLLLSTPTVWAASGCDDLRGTPIHFNVSWQLDIKPMINELISPDGRCTSCHNNGSPAAGLDLTDTNVDAIYKIINVIDPGNPLGSRLFEKLNCSQPNGGSQMPLGADPFTIAQRELFYDWIAQGAYGENPDGPDGPIFRDFMFRDGGESIR
jgi:hypothetical protein